MSTSSACRAWSVPDTWRAPVVPVEVSYRDDAMGGGAFWDHYTVQRATFRLTQIRIREGKLPTDLISYIKTGTSSSLLFGIPTAEGKIVPKVTEATDRVGLLIIPGHAHEMEKKRKDVFAERNEFEQALLRDALRRGRPILGICGGSIQIWNVVNGAEWNRVKEKEARRGLPRSVTESSEAAPSATAPPAVEKLLPFYGAVEAEDHASRKMPSIKGNGSIGNNVMVHGVRIPANSMLSSISGDGWRRYKSVDALSRTATSPAGVPVSEIHPELSMEVNSVHWEAPVIYCQLKALVRIPLKTVEMIEEQDEDTGIRRETHKKREKQDGDTWRLDPSAFSCTIPGVGLKGMSPKEGVIEAFEQSSGAPILGIVWHPEAHNPDGKKTSTFNRNLLMFMAQAGDAYAAKQRMLESFKLDDIDRLTAQLKKVHIK